MPMARIASSACARDAEKRESSFRSSIHARRLLPRYVGSFGLSKYVTKTERSTKAATTIKLGFTECGVRANSSTKPKLIPRHFIRLTNPSCKLVLLGDAVVF